MLPKTMRRLPLGLALLSLAALPALSQAPTATYQFLFPASLPTVAGFPYTDTTHPRVLRAVVHPA